MYNIRASMLGSILSNPNNYFTKKGSISMLPQVQKGIDREIISYSLYDSFVDKSLLEYEKQKENTKTIGNITLIGHADIVGSDFVVDIKNSKQNKDALIKEYKYQLAAYCYLFDKKKAFLFVDRNENTNTIVEACELIEVDISSINIEKILKALEKVLDKLNVKPLERKDVEPLFFQYEETKQRIEKLKNELKQYEEEIEKLFEKNNNVITNNYIMKPAFKRNLKYKIVRTDEPWSGEYKKTWELERVEHE